MKKTFIAKAQLTAIAIGLLFLGSASATHDVQTVWIAAFSFVAAFLLKFVPEQTLEGMTEDEYYAKMANDLNEARFYNEIEIRPKDQITIDLFGRGKD